jgi:hypothetical protein
MEKRAREGQHGMITKPVRLGDLVLTIDDIQVILRGRIICKFRVSHMHEPEGTLAELYGEVSEEDALEVVCKTSLTPRRLEILSRFLYLYESNIIKLFRDSTGGMTLYLFEIPIS